MGATAALKLRQVADNLEHILSLELFCAAQGVDFRKKKLGSGNQLGKGTRGIYAAIRDKIPFIERDEYMKDHMNAAHTIVSEFDENKY